MLVQVDFYKSTGKAYASGRVECDKMPWEDGILESIKENQDILNNIDDSFYTVVSDIPESQNDPNYRYTYSRLYKPKVTSK